MRLVSSLCFFEFDLYRYSAVLRLRLAERRRNGAAVAAVRAWRAWRGRAAVGLYTFNAADT